jgi:hypothetical protein
VEQVVAAGNLNDEEKAELLEFLNEDRAEKGLPLYNSEFKVEGSDDDSALDNSNDLTAVSSAAAAAAATGAASPTSWQERLEAWEELIQKENLKEMAEADRTKYEIPINPDELSRNTAEEMEQAEAQPPRDWAFWVSRRWWIHRPKCRIRIS